MKTIQLLLLWMLLPVGLAVAQEPEFICGTEMSETENKQLFKQLLLTNNDGQFLTANGTLRILVVFAEFENYNEEDQYGRPGGYWPDGGFPAFVDSYIDSTVTQNSTHKLNITNYFSQMSQGNYKVIGDVKTVHVPNNYMNNRSGANQWVLNHLDSEVNYANYDNWKKNADFIHTNTSDGIVDMIVIIYRGYSLTTSWIGEASLGFDSIMVDNNSTEIKGSYHYGYLSNEPTKGSGVTAQAVTNNSEYDMISVTHEISHWLLGPHPYKGGGPIISRYPSMLQGSWFYASSTNAYEAERLGWITPTVIDSSIGDVSGLELDDFLTTGDAVKIKVTGGGADEYYLLENRQHQSIYDNATQNSSDNGLFIHHIRGHYSSSYDDLRMLPSFGNWDWTTDGTTTVSSSTVSIMKKDEPNRSGLSYHESLPGVSGDEWMHAYRDEHENLFTGGIFRGNYVTSSFKKNSNPLFAANTNPNSLTWSGSSTDIAVKVVDESQGKITVDAYMNYDPYTITENTTWDGQIFLDQNTKVENNATLTILPGTTVYMAENVQLDIRAGQGGTLISEGTEEEPIRFIRTDPNNAWKTIYLNSSAGSSIKWSLFDGGRTNLTIASQNNVIENSTFRNATFRNIDSWYNNDGSGNSSATLSHVLIEDGATVGLVAQYIDLDISNTTIQDNGQAGILVTSASVYPFHRNKVTNNGGSYHDGLAVTSSGTFYMHDDNLEDGYNEVFGNAGDEVSGSGDIAVGFTYPVSDGGYNSVHGDFSGGFYLVNNTSSTTVMAERVWWGQSFPQSSMFNGPVQFDMLFLYSDPTTGENSGTGGQTPAKALPGKEGEVLPLAEAYDQLERELEKAETEQQIRDGLHRLYQVAWLAKEKSPKLTGRFRQLARQSATGSNRIFELTSHNNTLQHAATLLYAKSYLRDGDYETADRWLRETDDLSLEGNDRRDWLHLEMDLHRYNGNVDAALETLKELYAHEESRGVDIESVKLSYQPIEEDIVRRMGGDGSVDPDRAKQNDDLSSTEALTLQNYPNPFNPTTQITFTLPEQSDVALVVYDMLGREVARLVDEVLPAGEQTVRFDASHLANGVYIYRLNANQQERVRMMTLIK
jgi:hypothetical protein